MLRKLKRLKITAILYTCATICIVLLFINFNEDVKRLLQQQEQRHGTSLPQLDSASSSPTELKESIGPVLQSDPPPSPSHQVHPLLLEYERSFLKAGPEMASTVLSKNLRMTGSSASNAQTRERLIKSESNNLASLSQDWNHSVDNKGWWATKEKKGLPKHVSSLVPLFISSLAPTPFDNLYHEDASLSDRIIEQLMYVIDEPSSSLPRSSTHTINDDTINDIRSNKSHIHLIRPGQTFINSSANKAIPNETQLNFTIKISDMEGRRRPSCHITRPLSSSHRRPLLNGSTNAAKVEQRKMKTILLYYGLGMTWGSQVTHGRNIFVKQHCPVNTCRLTGNRAHISLADAVVFKDVYMNPKVDRRANQLWIMHMLESPLNTQNFLDRSVFNLSATYRHDSDIVTPYEKWMYYDSSLKAIPQGINYAAGKKNKVAWFVSNCVAKNNRLEYARELSKYIQVDIYGACGTHTCPRATSKQCFDLLANNYKFYLAFENSNCRDYITEKFFVNSLGNNVVPIVMGAHPDDYKRAGPEKSYIHVDDFASPKELAQYLLKLDANDVLYNEYFQWKGTGEFIDTHFFCRLCAMVHYGQKHSRTYADFNKWWRGPGICTRGSWRNQRDVFSPS